MNTLLPPNIVDGALGVLVESFCEDRLVGWWLRPGPARSEAAEMWFRYELTTCKTTGGVVLVFGSGEGAAVLFPPKSKTIGWRNSLVSQFAIDLRCAGIWRIWRLLYLRVILGRFYGAANTAQLRYIGVGRMHRGKGIGERLLWDVSRVCSQRGWNCALETTSQDAKRFFERAGWQLIGEKRILFFPAIQIFVMQRPAGG